jgi:hypothetical protein
MGSYRNIFSWISRAILGGSRSIEEVKYYVERVVLGSAPRFRDIVLPGCDSGLLPVYPVAGSSTVSSETAAGTEAPPTAHSGDNPASGVLIPAAVFPSAQPETAVAPAHVLLAETCSFDAGTVLASCDGSEMAIGSDADSGDEDGSDMGSDSDEVAGPDSWPV